MFPWFITSFSSIQTAEQWHYQLRSHAQTVTLSPVMTCYDDFQIWSSLWPSNRGNDCLFVCFWFYLYFVFINQSSQRALGWLTDLAASSREAWGTLADVVWTVNGLLAGSSIVTLRCKAVWEKQTQMQDVRRLFSTWIYKDNCHVTHVWD